MAIDDHDEEEDDDQLSYLLVGSNLIHFIIGFYVPNTEDQQDQKSNAVDVQVTKTTKALSKLETLKLKIKQLELENKQNSAQLLKEMKQSTLLNNTLTSI